MKNDLKEKLNTYRDALKCNEQVLDGAFKQMTHMQQRKATQRQGWQRRYGFAIAAAAVVFFAVIGVILGNYVLGLSNNPNSGGVVYSLSSLKRQQIDESEYLQIFGTISLPEGSDYDGRFFVYVDDEATIFAARAVFKAARDGIVEEVGILSDLRGGLVDIAQRPQKDQSFVIKQDFFENGEYYSAFCADKGGVLYYVTVMSPIAGGGQFYEEVLL